MDLMVLDPPYNLTKSFNGRKFTKRPVDEYATWLDSVVGVFLNRSQAHGDGVRLRRLAHFRFNLQCLLCTFHRPEPNHMGAGEGPGAQANWKNCSEDTAFCTCSDNYTFNVDAVSCGAR